jgi:translation initiation factor 2B subunit (eIF-2B alpha/beta/delta family)
MAILGADLILEDRFLNKSGSFPIALMFEHAGLPVYLLADERKLFQEDDISTDILRRIENESNKPLSDFGIALDKRLTIHNHYFEYTPLSLVNQLFLGEETK